MPRIHRNISATTITLDVSNMSRGNLDFMDAEKNRMVNNLITRMLAYSAMNRRAKVPLLYSVLNPDTSSDSPSAKSKGVRFVSARVVVNQHINSIGNINIGQVVRVFVIFVIVKEVARRRGLRRISAILTS